MKVKITGQNPVHKHCYSAFAYGNRFDVNTLSKKVYLSVCNDKVGSKLVEVKTGNRREVILNAVLEHAKNKDQQKMRKEFFLAIPGTHTIDSLVSKTVTPDHHVGMYFSFVYLDGKKIEGQRVYISDPVLAEVGRMVYGNNINNLDKYYLEVIKNASGKYYLFVKYQSIIGSRRIAEIDPASLENWFTKEI